MSSEKPKTQFGGRIDSIAISPLGLDGIAVVAHNDICKLDLRSNEGRETGEVWHVSGPSQSGNRLQEVRRSAALYFGKERALLLRHTIWRSDPKGQINISEVDLRNGEVVREWRFPSGGPYTIFQPILIGNELLLIAHDHDATIVNLSSGEVIGAMRESLWESSIWESGEDGAYSDDYLCHQGLAWNADRATLHALFYSHEFASLETYKWNLREETFKIQKRRVLRDKQCMGLAVHPAGTIGIWMTNSAGSVTLPATERQAVTRELGEMLFISPRNSKSVSVHTKDASEFGSAPQLKSRSPARFALDVEPYPAFPFFCSDSDVMVNTPRGALLRVDSKSGTSEEVYRCGQAITASAYSPTTGKTVLGFNDGRLVVLAFDAVSPPRTPRFQRITVPTREISKTKKKSPPNVRRAEKRIEGEIAEGRTGVFLTDMQLTELPERLFETQSWERLGFSYNRVQRMPDEIGSCSELWELLADHNALQELPTSIGKLRKLRIADFSNNQIVQLPSSFGDLGKLESLNFANNRLKQLPESIANLRRLTELDIAKCPIGKMPDAFQHLTKLKILRLDSTEIRKLPDWIGKLTQLEELHLSYNHIQILPSSMRAMTKLRYLGLGYNPLVSIPNWLCDMESLSDLNLVFCKNLRSVPSSLSKIGEVSLYGTPVDPTS